MTRATPKPLVREVEGGRYGSLAVALTSDLLTICAKGAKWNGPASYSVTHAQVYQWAAMARADQLRRERTNRKRAAR